MNILFLHDEPWDSGIANYALTLALEMKTRGHRVQFWCQENSFAAKECRQMRIDSFPLKNPWANLWNLRQKIKENHFEIINAHTGSTQTLALAIKGSIPLIRTRADARPAAKHLLSRFISHRTSRLIAANTHIEAELKSFSPQTPVDLVFQGIDGAPSGFRQENPPHQTIGILGRLDPVKGHEIFIEAAAMLKPDFPQAQFLIAGEARPTRLTALQKKVSCLEIEETVSFLGRVENIWDFISQCAIGVVSSIGSEAVSRAALEWMSAGRPLISSRVGGLPDFIENGQNGLLVSPQNARELAAALEKLLRAPDRAHAMGEKARKSFENLFSLKKFGDSTEKVFLTALGAPHQ